MLMPAAVTRFRKLIRKAKDAASRWNDAERVTELGELESVTGQIYARTHAENWAVNPAVHYNEWANLTPNDMRPVVEAFRDLFDHLRCSRCGGLPRVSKVGYTETTLACPCNRFSVSLTPPEG